MKKDRHVIENILMGAVAHDMERLRDNLFVASEFVSNDRKLYHDKETFSIKWEEWDKQQSPSTKDIDYLKKRFLHLYGFENEEQLACYLKDKQLVFDAGCGLGIKTKWIADLAPNSIVIAMDISDSVYIAAKRYEEQKNLVFIRGDISKRIFKSGVFDLIICD